MSERSLISGKFCKIPLRQLTVYRFAIHSSTLFVGKILKFASETEWMATWECLKISIPLVFRKVYKSTTGRRPGKLRKVPKKLNLFVNFQDREAILPSLVRAAGLTRRRQWRVPPDSRDLHCCADLSTGHTIQAPWSFRSFGFSTG